VNGVAWRIVRVRANRGSRNAIEAVWQAWLRRPDDERWAALTRWRGGPALADAVFAAAVDPARSATERAALGAFCARHELAPGDPVRRALFYVLTGQAAQHRAADPDGSLLAAGYRAADEPGRSALRQAIASSDGLDLVRVVAARREPARPMTDAERRFLAGELTRRRDWAALWRLATGLPLDDAAAAARLLVGGGWRPADEQGRELLLRLAGTRPDTIDRVGFRPRKPTLRTVPVTAPGPVRDVSFSPDGRRLAVMTTLSSAGGLAGAVHELELPHGAVVARYDYPDRRPERVLHLGDAIVAGTRKGLDRLVGGRRETIDGSPGPITHLAAYPGGLLAQTGDRLLFCDRRGRVSRGLPLRSARFRAVDPASGRLAVQGPNRSSPNLEHILVLGPFGENEVARSRPLVSPLAVCFLSSDRLAGWEQDTLRTWEVQERRLVGRSGSDTVWPSSVVSMVAIPARDEIAVLVKNSWGPAVHYFDAETLFPSSYRHGLVGMRGTALWSSPEGGTHAVSDGDVIHVAFAVHPLASLVGRPMSEMTPADLAAVVGALRDPRRFLAEQPCLELLRACLEYRFGADIAVGPATPFKVGAAEVGAADIALAPGE
jgi:hypothetical protein